MFTLHNTLCAPRIGLYSHQCACKNWPSTFPRILFCKELAITSIKQYQRVFEKCGMRNVWARVAMCYSIMKSHIISVLSSTFVFVCVCVWRNYCWTSFHKKDVTFWSLTIPQDHLLWRTNLLVPMRWLWHFDLVLIIPETSAGQNVLRKSVRKLITVEILLVPLKWRWPALSLSGQRRSTYLVLNAKPAL